MAALKFHSKQVYQSQYNLHVRESKCTNNINLALVKTEILECEVNKQFKQ